MAHRHSFLGGALLIGLGPCITLKTSMLATISPLPFLPAVPFGYPDDLGHRYGATAEGSI